MLFGSSIDLDPPDFSLVGDGDPCPSVLDDFFPLAEETHRSSGASIPTPVGGPSPSRVGLPMIVPALIVVPAAPDAGTLGCNT